MTITSWMKSAVTAAAALLYLTLPAGTHVKAAGGQNCLTCLVQAGCFENCNCTCSLWPGQQPYISGCNPDGSARVSCEDDSQSPPHYGTSSCSTTPCGGYCAHDNELC
jgi:hypothetical protein